MKKITLLVVASILLVGNMALASENPVFSDNTDRRGYYIDYRDAEPIILKNAELSLCCFQMENLTSTQDQRLDQESTEQVVPQEESTTELQKEVYELNTITLVE